MDTSEFLRDAGKLESGLRAANSAHPNVRYAAVRDLYTAADRVLRVLEGLAIDPDPDVREQAMTFLERLEDAYGERLELAAMELRRLYAPRLV